MSDVGTVDHAADGGTGGSKPRRGLGDGPGAGYGFDAATALHRSGEGRWRAHVAGGWDMGGVPNGGYLLAIAARAMLAEAGRRDPIALTAQYVARAAPGPATVDVDLLRRGRRHDHLTARLHQASGGHVEVVGIVGELEDDPVSRRWDAAPPMLPAPQDCPRLEPATPPDPLPPPHTGQVELRLPVDQLGFALGAPTGDATIRGWARFPDGRPVDALALALFADAFPPAVFNADLPLAWVPSLQLSVQLRRRPVDGWLRCDFRTRQLTGAYLEEDGEIRDGTGEVVALVRQLALAPRAPAAGERAERPTA